MDDRVASGAVRADMRGILAPEGMERVEFRRLAPIAELEGLIELVWWVRWSLPSGERHPQRLLPQHAVNVSVGCAPPPGDDPPPGPYRLRGVVNGPVSGRTARVLTGEGWNLALKSTVGGFGAWVDDVAALVDRVVPMDALLAVEGDALAQRIASMPFDEAVLAVQEALARALDARPAARVVEARELASIAARIDDDPAILRVEHLAEAVGIGVRTLQRRFRTFVGVGPAAVIRRRRLAEAAERAREADVDLAALAAELGYVDQAHLTNDFTRYVGDSPAAYARARRGEHDRERQDGAGSLT